ncbi:hypothetical protein KPG66_01985, partial [Mycetohabitans sp. B2]|nr:hypothetical protein [Mycetohabitans sp. B2]
KPTGNAELDKTLGNIVANVMSSVAGGVVGGAQGAQAAYNVDRFNRQLHEDTKAKEQTLAKKLAAESGGKYTVQQIEDQMAQMNLMTSDGGMLPGNVRVASGDKPQDGTAWTLYGVNRAGQTVWTQSLGSGDADLQTYIVKGAQGSGFSYQPTTDKFTQYSAGVSGTLMLPFVGAGGGLSMGISTDGTMAGTSPFIQVQANGMASAGAYAGVGGSVGVSHTNGPLTSGASTGGYAELDAGFGPSGGANFSINDNETIGGIGGAAPMKVFPGVGYGAGIGAGLSTTSTIVLPSWNDLFGHKK